MDPRSTVGQQIQKGGIQPSDFSSANTRFHLDLCFPELFQPLSGGMWRGVLKTDDGPAQARFQDRSRAGRRLALMTTRLECHAERRAASRVTGLP